MSNQKFIEDIAFYIKKHAHIFNIKVYSPIIAQAILESASGTSELGANANNFFGLKYNPNSPNRVPSICGVYHKIGSEQNPDGSYTSSAMQWCKFANMEEGVKGYFEFLKNGWGRYDALPGITDPEEYLQEIKDAGFATSIKYVPNLMNVIEKYDLTQYDAATPSPVPTPRYYRVQVGAYSVYDNAIAKQNEIKDKGFDCIIKKVANLYKCQMGAFSNKANAEDLLQRAKQAGYRTAFIAYL